MTSFTNENTNNEVDIVEMLRTKTEEVNMDSYLIANFGGYTKKSVLDYLAVLRKQQQAMTDNFNRNLQAVLEEKENIKKSNSTIQMKLNKLESEYKNLSETMLASRSYDNEINESDIPALISKAAALEEELKRSKYECEKLQREKEHLENASQNFEITLEQAYKETAAQKEMVTAEKLETKKQRDLVAELSGLLESEQDETKYWKGLSHDDQITELTLKVKDLTSQSENQTELIARQNSEISMKGEAIKNLNATVDNLKNTVNALSESFNNINSENEKLINYNKALSEYLEEEYKKTLILIQEKTDTTIEKMIALKKLSEANAKLSGMDMQNNKVLRMDAINRNSKEMDEISKNNKEMDEISKNNKEMDTISKNNKEMDPIIRKSREQTRMDRI